MKTWQIARATLSVLAALSCAPPPSSELPHQIAAQPTMRFSAQAGLADAGPDAFSSAVLDFNDDGVQDLVLGGSLGLELFRGGPAGLVRQSVQASVREGYLGLGTADVDGDGRPELLVPGVAPVIVSVTPQGAMVLGPRLAPSPEGPVSPIVTLTEAGGPSLVGGTGKTVSRWGPPVAQASAPTVFASVPELVGSLLVSKAGQPGGRSLVVSQYRAGVTWFPLVGSRLGRGVELLDGGLTPDSLASGDVDGDGLEDLIVGLRYEPSVAFRTLPDGGFTEPVPLPVDRCGMVAAKDLDLDGRVEILCARFVSGAPDLAEVVVAQLAGAPASLAVRQRIALSSGVPVGIDTADFTGDGRPDLAVRLLGGSGALRLFVGLGP